MAEIQVERRKSSKSAGWLIALVLVAMLTAGWYFTMGPGRVADPADLEPTTGAEGSYEPAPPTPAPTPPGAEGGVQPAPVAPTP